ncbi:MAG: alpha/beta fold hydrolase [Gammaproteobacteria bacterium]|nr:alpha/beta fold hydrolase [Gammaproteobacteria bacterium]
MLLHHQIFAPEAAVVADHRPLIIVPGLFGSIANWRGMASALASHYEVVVVDQRNHGRSPHADSQSFDDMVSDLSALIDHHGWSSVLLAGHSLGGKVAMQFALRYPEQVDKLLVLDIAPVRYTHSHAPFLQHLMALDLSSLSSRAEADRALQAVIEDAGTRLFLLQSLAGSLGSYYWRLNLSVLYQYMNEMMDFPPPGASTNYQGPALFISGELSDYVRPEHRQLILRLFPHAKFNSIADAGHWLHAEQPEAVLAVMRSFLNHQDGEF